MHAAMRGALRQHRVCQFCIEIALAVDPEGKCCKPLCPRHKGLTRIWEKISMEQDGRFDACSCLDIARGGVECDSMKSINMAMLHILDRDDVSAVRVKNRFLNPTGGGWRDVFINFYFNDDTGRYVCELQLMHTHLLSVREDMGAHHDYGQFRAAVDILKWHAKSGPTIEA